MNIKIHSRQIKEINIKSGILKELEEKLDVFNDNNENAT